MTGKRLLTPTATNSTGGCRDERIDLNVIVPRLARSPNAVWRELNVNMRSVKEVKCRLTIEGLKPLIGRHWVTLTVLRLRHLDFGRNLVTSSDNNNHIINAFSQLIHLKDFGLNGVEGCTDRLWIDLFCCDRDRTRNEQSNEHNQECSRPTDNTDNNDNIPTPDVAEELFHRRFPYLEVVSVDFVSDEVLRRLGIVYGQKLKILSLSQYDRWFRREVEDGAVKNAGEFRILPTT